MASTSPQDDNELVDDRPPNRPHALYYDPTTRILQTRAITTSYTPLQLAQLYNFPTGVDGSGQCIALIELGGGYRDKDLKTYFQRLNLPMPKVTSVSIAGARNRPSGDPNSADGVVVLNIEVVGAIAPGAHIVVYFAPNTNQGFLDAITTASRDSSNNPSVMVITWGGPEVIWTSRSIQDINNTLKEAAERGITVCCAAGDTGSGDGVNDGKAHVDFPASSPYVLGCGGTRLKSINNQVTSEVVWNSAPTGSATGGGISELFGLPTWQANVQISPSINDQHIGRGVPDVAANADPYTGYQVYVNGQWNVLGGTAAVAPLWAGLIALINQGRGKPVGYLNPFLYENYPQLLQNKALRDVSSGDNGGYAAGPGWDACTGLGTPDGARLLEALKSW